jgi:hypothetical protein
MFPARNISGHRKYRNAKYSETLTWKSKEQHRILFRIRKHSIRME